MKSRPFGLHHIRWNVHSVSCESSFRFARPRALTACTQMSWTRKHQVTFSHEADWHFQCWSAILIQYDTLMAHNQRRIEYPRIVAAADVVNAEDDQGLKMWLRVFLTWCIIFSSHVQDKDCIWHQCDMTARMFWPHLHQGQSWGFFRCDYSGTVHIGRGDGFGKYLGFHFNSRRSW